MVTKPTKRKPAPSRKRAPKKSQPSIWDEIAALGRKIPPDELALFPKDGARNLHHYLHGAPKQDPD
jgi:hypothetical protein